MKSILTSLLLVLFITTTHAQKPSKLDSLKNVLSHLPAEGKSFAGDTLRVRVLCEMGEGMMIAGNDSALNQLINVLKFAENLNYDYGKLKISLVIGRYYRNKNYILKSIEFYLKSLAIAEKLEYHPIIAQTQSNLGFLYLEIHDYKSALNYLLKYSEYCKKKTDTEKYILSINNIGIAFFSKKDYTNALLYFSKCKDESKKIKSNKLLNVGLINVGKVYYEQGKYKEAIIRYNEALNIVDGYNDRIAYISTEKALALTKLNKHKEALKTATIAYNNTPTTKLGQLSQIAKVLSEIHEKLGNTTQALKYYKLYSLNTIKSDSLRNSEFSRFINLDYQNEKQEQSIKELNHDVEQQQQQKNLALISLIIALMILGTIYFFYKSLQNKNKEIEVQKSEIIELNQNLEEKVEKRTTELKQANEELVNKNHEITEALFRGQTIERKRVAAELHDNLGSTLSALKWRLEALDANNLSVKERGIYESIKNMMGSAYEEVRHISHNLIPRELEENGLVGALMKMFESLNGNSNIAFHFCYVGNFHGVSKSLTLEIYSIILELTNNILKHSKATFAEIKIVYSNNNINIVVKDDGIGNAYNLIRGNGWKNIEERVTRSNGVITIYSEGESGLTIGLSFAVPS